MRWRKERKKCLGFASCQVLFRGMVRGEERWIMGIVEAEVEEGFLTTRSKIMCKDRKWLVRCEPLVELVEVEETTAERAGLLIASQGMNVMRLKVRVVGKEFSIVALGWKPGQEMRMHVKEEE